MRFLILGVVLLASQASAGRGRHRGDEAPEPPVRPSVESAAVAVLDASPGSLWSDVPARRMLGLQGAAREIGDLVTVRIMENTTTNLGASTSTSRDSQADAGVTSLMGIDQRLIAANPSLSGGLRVGGSSSTSFTGAGSTSRDASVESLITCEVLDVLPSGNLRVWGYKQVRVNREVQYVTLEGIVRPRDIRLDNTVASPLLAEARIEVTGGGVVADKQGPGLLVRILDAIWPF